MDGHQFDDLLRSLTDSRRTLLGGSLAAVAGWFGVATIEAKKRRKKKRKKRCKCPAGSGKVCQGKKKTCVCPTGEEDSGGVCGTRPTCVGAGESCGPDGVSLDCCSGFCLLSVCVNSTDGEPCYNSDQCSNQSECRGFACVAP